MNKRPSIYIGTSLEKIITDIQAKHDNKVSTVINAVAERYLAIVERNTPALHKNEWLAIMEVMDGYTTDKITQAVNGLSLTIEDAIKLYDLATKWQLSGDFTYKISGLSFEQKLAVVHVSERCGSFAAIAKEEQETVLQKCGARIL